MTRPPGIRRLFRLRAGGDAAEREIDDEIAFHIDERTASLIDAGVSPDDARRRAEREFGDVRDARAELTSLHRRTVRRERRSAWWEAGWHDARVALRGMRRDVWFTLAVVLMLGVGVGVNAAMFGITDRLLLSAPPHVAQPDEVVRVMYRSSRDGPPTTEVVLPYPDYVVLRDVPAFANAAAYTSAGDRLLGDPASAVEVQVASVTATFFPTLGVQPVLGRFFSAAEDALPQGDHVVVLGHGLWQERFGGAREVIGRTIVLDEARYEVVGVAPRGFTGMELDPVDAWTPLSVRGFAFGGDADWHATRSFHWLRVVARLAPGSSPVVAQQQATSAFLAANAERFEGDDTADIVLGSAIVGRAPVVGDGTVQRSSRIALWLLGVSAVVLVIACANVANLLLARGMRRRRELGVRVALGVGRVRLAVQVLIETFALALAGSALGLLFAHWAGQLGRAVLLPDVEWVGSPVSGRVLVVAIGATVLCTLLAGVLPALQALRSDGAAVLGGTRRTSRRSVARSALVAVQATLSVVLLVGAGLFVSSLHRAATRPLGFEPDRTLLVEWSSTRDWDRARIQGLYDAAVERVRRLPQVEAAAVATTAPMWSAMWGEIEVPGMDSVPMPRAAEEGPFFASVSPDYFSASGGGIVRGRAFDEGDVPGSTPVAIVTETTARMIWPGEDPIGKCFVHAIGAERSPEWYRESAPCRVIVGVAADTRYRSVLGEPNMMYYLPLAQEPGYNSRVLVVRPRGDDASAAIGAVREALASLETGLPYVSVTRLDERIEPQLRPWRLGASLFTAFGVLALLLAAVGLYGVVAYDVTQRRRELGVRVALGAGAVRLVRLVVGDAVRLVMIGTVLGLAASGWAARFIEPLLFDVSPRDPRVLVVVAALLLSVAAAAALLPALRAATVHPTEALREE